MKYLRTRRQLAAAALLTIAAVFIIDVASGPDISLSIFYLIPIGIATWQFSTRAGLLVSAVCALLWFIGDRMTGAVYAHQIVPYWNALVRLGFFVTVTLILATRRRAESELVAARARALEAASVKADFVNRVTHELRTPLTSIIGFSQVITNRSAPYLSEIDQECLRRICANAENLLRLVEGVLELGRIEVGNANAISQRVNLRALVADAAADLRARSEQKHLELILDAPLDLFVQTDPHMVSQILLNLLVNAVKFTEDGSVRLTLERDDSGEPVIAVQDTGIGIDAARMAAIFQPFEQANSSIHRTFGGTGLGLAIARDLCDVLGYKLEAQSKLGVGSTFRLIMVGALQDAPGEPAGASPERTDRAASGE